MSEARTLLGRVFGFPDFRPGQEEIVSAVEQGRDVLAIMPTGGGKSLCYQLPALTRPGVTLVISPLIALMRDQVRALRAAGVAAGALTSQSEAHETEEVFQAIDDGRLKLLYMAPERLAAGRDRPPPPAPDPLRCSPSTRPIASASGATTSAPTTCASASCAAPPGGVQTVALTATADAETRAEIVARLFGGRAPEIFLRGFDRPNLSLAFLPKDNPRRQILDYVGARRGQSGIVYCASRARTESLAAALNEAGHTALAYHAGLSPDDRRLAETRFQREDGLVVCATIAFGMGVDKPDIRYVAHADLPKSIEGYYQEIGRAGRDGAPADTLTLFGPDDIRLRRAQIDESPSPMERKQADHKRLNALLGLAEAKHCRRQTLLAYFGETLAEPCGNCDLCRDAPELFDATEAARMAFSAVLRTGESFGAEHLIAILRGEQTEKVLQRGHQRLPTFGVGGARSKAEWQAIFRQLMGLDLLRPDPSRHGALRLTEEARPLLRGETDARAPRRQRPAGGGAGRGPRRPGGAGLGRGRGPALGAQGAAPRPRRRRRRARLRHLPRPHPDRDGDRAPAHARRHARDHRRRRRQARALRAGLPRGADRGGPARRSTRRGCASPAPPGAGSSTASRRRRSRSPAATTGSAST